MSKTVLKDTHMLLDAGTLAKLRDIASWSEESSGLSRTIRAVTKRFHALLAQQVLVESGGRTLYLVEVGQDGVEVVRERLILKL